MAAGVGSPLAVPARYQGQGEKESDASRCCAVKIFRAAASIPASISDGRPEGSEKDFARFLKHPLNSSSELEYLLTTSAQNLYALLTCVSGTRSRVPCANSRAPRSQRGADSGLAISPRPVVVGS